MNGAEALDRTATRAALRELAAAIAEKFAFAIVYLALGAVAGGVLVYLGFQAWIGKSAGFWYLTSSYVIAAVGGLTVVVVWAAVKLLAFAARKPK
ncbi:MAG: hypothetical protein PVH29_06145 [Candidatus Zixiibacteriota bacterium]|jgi:hypothetical protein